jgi:hypothetical protein
MPGYIKDALHKSQHPIPKLPQYAPHNWKVPAYGQHIKYAPLPDAPPPETAQDIIRSQAIVGTPLYNARAVDPTISVPLSALASQLSTTTSTTINAVSHLLDYCSSRPEYSIRYFASDMQLKIHSDSSYLSEPKAKSRIGGCLYLGNKTNSPIIPSIMVHFCATHQYSNIWSHLLLRPNFMHFLSMQMKALTRAQRWLKWVTTRMTHN